MNTHEYSKHSEVKRVARDFSGHAVHLHDLYLQIHVTGINLCIVDSCK